MRYIQILYMYTHFSIDRNACLKKKVIHNLPEMKHIKYLQVIQVKDFMTSLQAFLNVLTVTVNIKS